MATRPDDLKARMAAGMMPQADAAAWPTPKTYNPDPNQGGYMQQLLANLVQGAAEGASFMPSGIREQFTSGTPEKVMPLMQTIALIGAMLAEPGPDIPIGKTAKLAEGALPDAAKKGITAYHGSPHNFDRFSTEAIGTGEGLQAYGRGLYFSEEPAVADSYRALSSEALKVPDAVKSAINDLDRIGLNSGRWVSETLGEMRKPNWMEKYNVNPASDTKVATAVETINKYLQDGPKGVGYKVNIDVNPDDLIDDDLPLGQQSEKVKSVLLDMLGESGRAALAKRGGENALMPSVIAALGPGAEARLAQSGIPGIKYFDANSRYAKQGTRNFVIFDDKVLSILEKYSLAGLIGAGVASGTIASQAQTEKPR